MRIDHSWMQNQIRIQSQPSKVPSDATQSTSTAKEVNNIRDTYEPAKNQLSVDFGGYDRTGRATGAMAKQGNPVNAVSNDFATKGAGQNKPYGSIVSNLSKALGVNEEEASIRVKDAGLAIEDLVNPEAVKNLSNEPAMQTKLQDFATDERTSLLAQSGMTGAELDQFVAAVR